MKKIIILLLLLVGIKSYAQNDTLTAEQAKVLVNKEVIVKAYVAGTRFFDKDGKKTFLINLDKKYPQTPLTVVLYDETYKALNLKEEIQDKKIVVKGVISLYNDRPQIIIKNTENLKVLN